MAVLAGEIVTSEAHRRVCDLWADDGEGLGEDLPAVVGRKQILGGRERRQADRERYEERSPFAPGEAAAI